MQSGIVSLALIKAAAISILLVVDMKYSKMLASIWIRVLCIIVYFTSSRLVVTLLPRK